MITEELITGVVTGTLGISYRIQAVIKWKVEK